ncbi:MAG: hypothetical protein KC464_17135, partial [Myxococcales bacterium]|nr:hypothetical protein [Myxococcales bacterium]
VAVTAALGAAACTHAGTGPEVHADVVARMETTRPAITACCAAALERDRKLRGLLVVRFVAAPRTGAFGQLAILRDDLGDPALAQCVVTEVGKLVLATPQRAAVSVTYPLDFEPTR